jgi:tripartite-type tricarboxylate transporter receptor subunit TctC
MKLPHRRRFLHLAASAAALPVVSRIARAQTYPTRPVRIVAGFAAGGAVDIVARVIAQSLSERLNQQFIVENRPGAGGNLAVEAVVNSLPDGSSLLLVGVNNAIGATLYEKTSFNFNRDIVPVAGIMRVPNIMVVSPTVSAKTVSEFIDYANANRGKLSYASSGAGTSVHMSAELFKMMTGVDLLHVPHRGLAAGGYQGLMSGSLHVCFDNLPGSIEFVRTGKLRGLAVTTTARSHALPDLPTVAETVPGFEASAWYGIGAPRNTPDDIVDKLNKEINSALAESKIETRLTDMGGMLLPGSSVAFGKLIADETEKWGKVVRAANIKAE